MPICEISYPRGLLSEDERNRVSSRITALLIEAEGLQDNAVSRSICLITINESEWVFIGGELSSQGKIVVKIYAFSEAYSEVQKSGLYSKIAAIFAEENAATRTLRGNNVWCLVLPIEANNFGVGGVAVSLEMTRKIVASHGKDA